MEGDLRTTLVIIQDQKKNIVAEGKSRQDSRDTDNKLKGQRVALANALKMVTIMIEHSSKRDLIRKKK